MFPKTNVIETCFLYLGLLVTPVAANASADAPQYQLSVVTSGDHGMAAVMVLDEKSGKLWEVDEQQPPGGGPKETWVRYIADISRLPDGQKIGAVVESTTYVDKHPAAPPAPGFAPVLLHASGTVNVPAKGAPPVSPHPAAK